MVNEEKLFLNEILVPGQFQDIKNLCCDPGVSCRDLEKVTKRYKCLFNQNMLEESNFIFLALHNEIQRRKISKEIQYLNIIRDMQQKINR